MRNWVLNIMNIGRLYFLFILLIDFFIIFIFISPSFATKITDNNTIVAVKKRGLFNDKNILSPIRVYLKNLRIVEHTLPTGRKITPFGLINGTPNFATNVAVWHNLVAVLANGATFYQSVTVYNKHTLSKIAQYRAYKERRLKKVLNTPNFCCI
jgi:hypothetical protein